MKRIWNAAGGAVIGVLAWVILAPVATAQLAWPGDLWGGGAQKNSISDRVIVDFPKNHDVGEIVVSFGDRRLYHVVSRGRAVSYPIGVPRAQSRWQGVERVSFKRVNPSWVPTPEMRRENPKLPTVMPGGHPQNPLGSRAIYLGNTLYRIHGTDAPSTIGQNVSRGCVRMHNRHVEELYDQVQAGAKVTATWQRFNSDVIADGGSGASEGFDLLRLLGIE